MGGKSKRAALYLRVSTTEQTTSNQRLALETVAEQRGWTVTAEYDDRGESGAKSRDQRPGLAQLLQDARRGKFNVVVVWALDRLGRSLADLIGTLQELQACGVDLVIQQAAIDTTTPAGKCFFHVLGAFAEFEREQTVSRIMAGLDRAKAAGKQLGRPKVGTDVEAAVAARLAAGVGVVKIARELGVGVSTVQRVKAEMAGPKGV